MQSGRTKKERKKKKIQSDSNLIIHLLTINYRDPRQRNFEKLSSTWQREGFKNQSLLKLEIKSTKMELI